MGPTALPPAPRPGRTQARLSRLHCGAVFAAAPAPQAQVGGVARAQTPFMDGQCRRKAAPPWTVTTPQNSASALEPSPSWQLRAPREPGHMGRRGGALPPPAWGAPFMGVNPRRSSQIWKTRVPQVTLPSRACAGGWSPHPDCCLLLGLRWGTFLSLRGSRGRALPW